MILLSRHLVFCNLGKDLAGSLVPNAKIAAFLPGLLLLRVPKIFGFVSICPPADLLLCIDLPPEGSNPEGAPGLGARKEVWRAVRSRLFISIIIYIKKEEPRES